MERRFPELETCALKIKTYTGQALTVLGSAQVKLKHREIVKELQVVVVPRKGPNLLGSGRITELGMK